MIRDMKNLAHTCLCCGNARTGSVVSGLYTLIVSVICVAFYVFRYIAVYAADKRWEVKAIVFTGFAVYAMMITVTLIMLPGVHMDNRHLLLPWIYVMVVTVLYETGAIALLTSMHLTSEKTLHAWEIVSVCFYCCRLVANCYSFACVVYHYQELSEGRGTFQNVHKPRWRRRASQASSDADSYRPPGGAQLPPYSLENPYKEFSPPDYEAPPEEGECELCRVFSTQASVSWHSDFDPSCERCTCSDPPPTVRRITCVTWI